MLLTIGGFYNVQGVYNIKTKDGRRVPRRNAFRRHVGFLFQEPHEYEFRSTVGEILSLGRWLEQAAHQEWHRFIESVFDAYDIPAKQHPRTLSSGQLRIIWVVSQLGWCSTWLLDEATATLDDDATALIEQLIALHVGWGGSVIATESHTRSDQRSAFRTLLGGGEMCQLVDLSATAAIP